MASPQEITKVALVKAKDRRDGVVRSTELLETNPVNGKKVLLKPNFNTDDPYPGSTHPDTLRELIRHLQSMGAAAITIGERSGPADSGQVMDSLGVYRVAEEFGVEVVNFDALPDGELTRVNPPGSHWKDGFKVPVMLGEAECIVISPCLKTHQFGGIFTMSLKLGVGLVPKAGNDYMQELHSSPHMGCMIAEVNTAYNPDLIVMDALEAFVEAGPMTGTKKEAGLFIAGTDRVAVDAVGVAVLKELGSTPEIMNTPVFKQEQIARAVELGLGTPTPEAIELVTGDRESAAYAAELKKILERG